MVMTSETATAKTKAQAAGILGTATAGMAQNPARLIVPKMVE